MRNTFEPQYPRAVDLPGYLNLDLIGSPDIGSPLNEHDLLVDVGQAAPSRKDFFRIVKIENYT